MATRHSNNAEINKLSAEIEREIAIDKKSLE